MSFTHYKKTIEEGDTVILFLGFDNMLQFTVEKKKVHQTKYGALRHKDLLGVAYGSKVHCTKGYAHVLHPTPELWTVNLPHRTQILYATDISLVTMQLDLKPGSVVVESGTGSGSLSHSLLRSITPGGFLHTFDFHEMRVSKAQKEFKDHGFGDSVTVQHRDVLRDGFDLENVADAVFLDLPSPWDALPHARRVLKKTGGRLCSFSPCIEQVQKACEKLEELGFCEIETTECLTRAFDVRTVNMPVPDLGFSEESEQVALEDCGGSVHHPLIGHIEGGYTEKGRGPGRGKRRRGRRQAEKEQDASDMCVDDCKSGMSHAGETSQGMPRNSDDNSDCEENAADQEQKDDQLPDFKRKKLCSDITSSYVFKSGIAPNQMQGHTGFLTFATLTPG